MLNSSGQRHVEQARRPEQRLESRVSRRVSGVRSVWARGAPLFPRLCTGSSAGCARLSRWVCTVPFRPLYLPILYPTKLRNNPHISK